jgi:hypothetical protein
MRLVPILTLLTLLAAPVAAGQEEVEVDPDVAMVVGKLYEGWTYMEAGSLSKAEAAFTAAYESRVGRDRADVYYGLSAIWWEKRNAMAAYSWLVQAQATSKTSWYWNGGEDGEWDRRIMGRIRYIERNFSVIKLRSPRNGRPLPPLADPPPSDPLLVSFVDVLAGQVAEGVAAGARVQWFFLPNCVYWIGGEEVVHEGGEMEPTRATTWQMVADRGSARRKYAERVAVIAADRAAAEADLQARRLAALEVWNKSQEGGGTQTAQSAGGDPGQVLAEASTPAPVRARPYEVDPDQRPIGHRLVTWDTTRQVSDDLTQRWRAAGFHARYGVTCPNSDAEHEIDWADAEFYLRFDARGELKVRGVERLTEKLRGDWLCGGKGELNMVELYYDGRKLLVVVNGVEFGPVTVRRSATNEPVGRWEITLTDARAEIQHLWIEPWDGT